MITAKKVYKEILEMPLKERERLFSVIAVKDRWESSNTPLQTLQFDAIFRNWVL